MHTYNCDTSDIKCIDANENNLTTGGDDNQIILFYLNSTRNNKIQSIFHKSPVNSLKFSADGRTLFAGFERGEFVAIKVSPFALRKEWITPHNGKPIWNISIHPSGTLGVTIGGDSLLTWNMIIGEKVFIQL